MRSIKAPESKEGEGESDLPAPPGLLAPPSFEGAADDPSLLYRSSVTALLAASSRSSSPAPNMLDARLLSQPLLFSAAFEVVEAAFLKELVSRSGLRLVAVVGPKRVLGAGENGRGLNCNPPLGSRAGGCIFSCRSFLNSSTAALY